ncbi:MAG: hypothetical protein ACYC7A_17700 [Thermoanaerobaculia bacterium]
MNSVTFGVGIAAIVYGVYTAWARSARPHQFRKLDAMKKSFGESGGTIVHFIAYTVVPIGVGIVFVFRGLAGLPLF